MEFGMAFKLIPVHPSSSQFIKICDTVIFFATPEDNPTLLSIIYSKLDGKAFEFSREAVYVNCQHSRRLCGRNSAQPKRWHNFRQTNLN
jgi:hypothetical protein